MIRILQTHKWENTLYDRARQAAAEVSYERQHSARELGGNPSTPEGFSFAQSGCVPHTPIQIFCKRLVSVATLVLQRQVDITLGGERHKRQRFFSQLYA